MRISDNPGLFHGLLYIIRHREFLGVPEGIPLPTRTKMPVGSSMVWKTCVRFDPPAFPRAFVSVKEWFPLCEITDLVMNLHVRHDVAIVYRVTIIYRIFHCMEYNFFEPDFLPLAAFMAGVLPQML